MSFNSAVTEIARVIHEGETNGQPIDFPSLVEYKENPLVFYWITRIIETHVPELSGSYRGGLWYEVQAELNRLRSQSSSENR